MINTHNALSKITSRAKKLFEGRSADTNFGCSSLIKFECIFFHIPRTSGIAIAKTIFGNNGAGHLTVEKAKTIFGDRYDQFYKFSIVRNPYEKLMSSYFYLKGGGFHEGDKKWVKLNWKDIDSFESFIMDWLNADRFYERFHFQPQVFFLMNKSNEIDLDYIGRYEELDASFKHICKKLNVQRQLKRMNLSQKPLNYNTLYTREMKKKVYKLYKEDFYELSYYE